MDGLDFGQLSDDQILGLIRAALREVVSRSPALAAAAEAAMLDEAERARIMAQATEAEAARMRAAERQRVAAEAAAKMRASHEAQQAEAGRHRASTAAETAAAKVRQQQEANKGWLRSAAKLVGRKPGEISVKLVSTNYGRRVLIDEGAERWNREHLVDWNHGNGHIKTARDYIKIKPDLAAFCARLEAKHTGRELVLVGAEQDWTGEQP